mgnify:CR=1 FL=1
MKNEDGLELLGRVGRVDPPPFLFTRIEARLAQGAIVPRGRLVAIACALAVLLLANAAVLTRVSGTRNGSSLGDVVDVMGMNASNQLYE